MPTAYIQKLSKELGRPVGELESKWEEAKQSAEDQDKGDDYAYITGIFQHMIGAGSRIKAGADKKDILLRIANALQRALKSAKLMSRSPVSFTYTFSTSPNNTDFRSMVNTLRMAGFSVGHVKGSTADGVANIEADLLTADDTGILMTYKAANGVGTVSIAV